MQNPFGFALFVFGDWYFLMYLGVIFFFIIIGPFARGRYKSVYYTTKYLRYYFAFVFFSLVCILLNTAARMDIELIPTVRFIGRLFQFYVIYNVVRIVGVSSILRWMYRFAVVFSLLTIVFSLLNLFGMSNIFFNIAPITDDHAMYYSFPYGFTEFLIPHTGNLQMSSYFTEASNYAYYLILFLVYAAFKFTESRQVGYFVSALLFLTSIALTQSVAGYATVLILIAFVTIRTKLRSISIINSLFLLVFLTLFIWSGFFVITFLLLGEIENSFLIRRALSTELRIQEWMMSLQEIIKNPLGFGIGNVSPVADALNSERIQGFGRGYGGPTNFLAPIYSLGIPYLLPFMFYGVVLIWCLRIKLRASNDLRMVSVMVVAGIVASASYYQMNTAVFHVTLAALLILLSQEGKEKVIVLNPLGEQQSRQ
tara:strand:+ start:245 stop:1519 length:1275 start_codon:yes stop_codon:yes gene_type:complete